MKAQIEALEKTLITEYHKFFEVKDEILTRLDDFNTTEISDATQGKSVLDPGIKPLDPSMRLMGRALTVQLPPTDGLFTLDAISAAKPGDILVIQSGGCLDRAVWGDIKTTMAMKKRIGGIVVDGVVRDKLKNIELGFPIFCRGNVVQASGKAGGGALNIPVECGGVLVNPGDFIMADADGVVAIPSSQIEQVIEAAMIKLISDREKILKVLTT